VFDHVRCAFPDDGGVLRPDEGKLTVAIAAARHGRHLDGGAWRVARVTLTTSVCAGAARSPSRAPVHVGGEWSRLTEAAAAAAAAD